MLGFLIPHAWMALAHYQLDDFAAAHAAAAAARSRAERRSDTALLVQAVAVGAGLHWITGEWDDSLADVDAALTLQEETGLSMQRIYFHTIAAVITLARDNRSGAETHLAAGEAVLTTGSFHLFGLDLLLWARARQVELDGQPDAAWALLDSTWEQTLNLRGLVQWRNLGPDLVRLSVVTGRLDRARSVADQIAVVADRSSSTSARAAALRARGLAYGDADLLVQAADAFRQTPRRIDLAAACEEAATALLRQGRPRRSGPPPRRGNRLPSPDGRARSSRTDRPTTAVR